MKKLFCVLISIMLIFSLGMCLFACDNSGGGNTSSSGLGDSSLSSGDSSSSNGGDSSSFDNSSSSSSSSGNDSSTVSPVDDYEFELIGPSGEVYPYAEDYKAYLMAEGDVNVASYCGKNTEAYSAVVIEWKNTSKNLQSYIVEYGTKADFSDATSHELSPAAKKLRLYNLYKATTYYVRVTANYKDGSSESADGSFSTTDNGPRTMKIDGIYNVRDMGGYVTASGKRTVQGRFFRGGALSPSTFAAYNHVSLSDNGKKYMSETLGVKTDFDLRSLPENLNLTKSPIPDANLEYYGIDGYLSAFQQTESYKRVFAALADESRYPVYMHCTGGADRTGTVAFLINALLGVDEKTLIRDYETTSFSLYEERNSKTTAYAFTPFVNRLKTYGGETLQEKTENYMLSIGVTETEIYNIKAIMFGEPTKALPVVPVVETVKAFGNGTETVTLKSDESLTGTTAFGYTDKIIEFDIGSATDDGNGGTIFMIGSYGFKARGSSFRYMTLDGSTLTEHRGTGNEINFADTFFRSGKKVGLKVLAKSETEIELTVYVDGEKIGSLVKTRVTGEVAETEAFAKVELTSAVYTLTLLNVKR